jgi:hypothetical protein
MSDYSYDPFALAALEQQHKLPSGMLEALKYAENSGDSAVSPKGAEGVMQTMPSTAQNPGYGVPPFDPRDPEGTARYVAALYQHSGQDPVLTAAAYNAGLGGDYTNPETSAYIKRFQEKFGKGQQPQAQNDKVIAELPDGRRLEFPAGTSPQIVQQTVKKVLGNVSTPNGSAGAGAVSPFANNPAASVGADSALRKPLGWQQELTKKFEEEHGNISPAEAQIRASKTPEFSGDIPGGGEALSALGKALGLTGKAATPLQEAGKAAQDVGFKIPPSQVRPGPIKEALEGFGGRVQLQQVASAKNQAIATDMAKQAIGIPKDVPLTQQAIDNVQAKAATAYDTLKRVPFKFKSDAQYQKDIADLSSSWTKAAKKFTFMKNDDIEQLKTDMAQKVPMKAGSTAYNKVEPDDAVEVIKDLRFKAKANYANRDDPAKLALAAAQRKAADAMEGLIDRNLKAKGDFTTYKNFTDARTLYAKSIDVEKAFNKSSGTINPQYFAGKLMKNKPLSGELDDIGTAAASFPKSFQNVEKMGATPRFSILDMFGSAMNPKWLAATLARPAVRSALLSKAAQQGISPKTTEAMIQQALNAAKAGGSAAGDKIGDN